MFDDFLDDLDLGDLFTGNDDTLSEVLSGATEALEGAALGGFIDVLDLGGSEEEIQVEAEDIEVGAFSAFEDGTSIDITEVDMNGDGVIDGGVTQQMADLDGNGIAESLVTSAVVDNDYDGTVDVAVVSINIDDDGDGNFNDSIQATYEDTTGDGVLDSMTGFIDVGNDGVIDATMQGYVADMDDDGIPETQVMEIGTDTTGDGIIDTVSVEAFSDTDGDDVADMYTQTVYVDTDGDGVYDTQFVVQDINNDGLIDAEEDFIVDSQGALFPEDAVEGYEDYDVSFDDNDDIVGNPASAVESWHVQDGQNSCAVVCQEFVLEQLTGEEFNEDDLCDLAEENGWFTPEGGTSMDDVGNILEHMGMDVEKSYGNTIDDLEECLENGGQVIVAVDSSEIWTGHNDDFFGPGMDPDHAVQVIGVDYSDPENPMVILNDSGTADGAGCAVSMDVFMASWEDSGCFMVEAYAPDNQ